MSDSGAAIFTRHIRAPLSLIGFRHRHILGTLAGAAEHGSAGRAMPDTAKDTSNPLGPDSFDQYLWDRSFCVGGCCGGALLAIFFEQRIVEFIFPYLFSSAVILILNSGGQAFIIFSFSLSGMLLGVIQASSPILFAFWS